MTTRLWISTHWVLIGCALAALAAEPAPAGRAEIVIVRGDTHCPGFPALDVRLDGGAHALVAANEFLRLVTPPGPHTLELYPANPEHIAVEASAGTRYAFLATTFRVGWRCKFELAAVQDAAEVERLMAAVKELPLAVALSPRPELNGTAGQLILTKP